MDKRTYLKTKFHLQNPDDQKEHAIMIKAQRKTERTNKASKSGAQPIST